MTKCAKFIVCFILICITLMGCSSKNEQYIIPVNYSGEASVEVFEDKTKNSYDVKIICKDGGYNFTINDGDSLWNVAYKDNVCYLNNDKFNENSVRLDNFKIIDSLLSEFDFSKFDISIDPVPKELIYWDGTYKHVLNFSKENLLPEKIFIYKNDNLVKAIQYNIINIDLK